MSSFRRLQVRPSFSVSVVVVTLFAFGLRSLRLNWQPLWWDEGYSVYFATEPLRRMASLTAQDIHPPLYYAVLHGWIGILSDAQPAVVRLFSISVGVCAVPLLAVLTYRLTNRSRVAGATAALLLTLNPLHVYYSQEVRMYSLATTLALASTLALVLWLERSSKEQRALGPLIVFTLLTVAMLYTLYYTALLLVAQFILVAWKLRRERRIFLGYIGALIGAALLLTPWLVYAVPKLVAYVNGKVVADQDMSLNMAEYAWRHMQAFIVGHDWNGFINLVGVSLGCVLSLLLTTRNSTEPTRKGSSKTSLPFLAALFLIPLVLGYTINLVYPFFPEHGERLLLFTLPYALGFVGACYASSALPLPLKSALLVPLLSMNILGIYCFYSTPRYTERDYRPIVASVTQLGNADDTVLALFPWQVGYWRAYAPRNASGALAAPQPEPLGQEFLEWDEHMRNQIDEQLDAGTLWFPEPLSFGSTLPYEIEQHLNNAGVNVLNRWYSEATRLTGWTARAADTSTIEHIVDTDFGNLIVTSVVVSDDAITSANSTLQLDIHWQRKTMDADPTFSIQLVDGVGREWARRDYSHEPSTAAESADGAQQLSCFGMLIPYGIPPGAYTLQLSVLTEDGYDLKTASDESMVPGSKVSVTDIKVAAQSSPAPSYRAPVTYPFNARQTLVDMHLLGAWTENATSVLAGTELSFRAVLQSINDSSQNYSLRSVLWDQNGNEVASYEGWSLPDYTSDTWPMGSIVQVPVTIQIPGYLQAGTYSVGVGLVSQSSPAELAPQPLFDLSITRREASYTPIVSANPIEPPAQFATHVLLHGYELQEQPDGIRLLLEWEALQPILPQQSIFVHVANSEDSTNGEVIVAQQDGEPTTPTGAAPTGSWQTGEWLTTVHDITLSGEELQMLYDGELVLRVGMYDPETGIRLPVAIDGTPIGDSVNLTEP